MKSADVTKYLILAVTFVCLAGPGLAQALSGVGLSGPAHLMLAIVGAASSAKLLFSAPPSASAAPKDQAS